MENNENEGRRLKEVLQSQAELLRSLTERVERTTQPSIATETNG